MNIFLVEDKIDEVSGYMRQFDNGGWSCERFATFTDAYEALVKKEDRIDLFIIDIMLPWGKTAHDEVERLYDWKRAGVYLIYAIRGIGNRDLEEIRTRSGMKKMTERYKSVPIIALTKVPETIEDEMSKVPNVAVVPKLEGLKVSQLAAFVQGLSKQVDE